MKKVAFIIVTYNSQSFIEKCLDSIDLYEPNCEIIIVDNGSVDSTKIILKNKYPSIRLIESNENLGFGKANNIGIKVALNEASDYVYLLNHDAYLIEPVVQKLIDILEKNEDVGIVSPFHLDASEVKLENQFYKFMYQQGILNQVYSDGLRNREYGLYEVDFIPAASWFISKQTIKLVGLFNEIFYHYGEDNNYLQRILYWKKKILVTNNCHVVHIGNSEKRSYNKNYQGFHVLLLKANFSSKFLNINNSFSYKNIFNDVKNDLRNLILASLKINIRLTWNIVKLIFWKIAISRYFKLNLNSQRKVAFGF